MTMLAALRRADQTVLVKRGCFYVPEGQEKANLTHFLSVARQRVLKYMSRFESEGWTLRSEPKVKKVRMADTEKKRAVLDTKGDVALKFPTDAGMRKDHPWYKAGADMYEVSAYWSKPNRLQTFELSDKHVEKLIKTGRLPAGLRVE